MSSGELEFLLKGQAKRTAKDNLNTPKPIVLQSSIPSGPNNVPIKISAEVHPEYSHSDGKISNYHITNASDQVYSDNDNDYTLALPIGSHVALNKTEERTLVPGRNSPLSFGSAANVGKASVMKLNNAEWMSLPVEVKTPVAEIAA